MKDRLTMGLDADAAETAALTIADEFATERIYDSADWEHMDWEEKRIVRKSLRRLSTADRKFARAVLKGVAWRESGMTKRGFNKRLKKIINFLSNPVNIG